MLSIENPPPADLPCPQLLSSPLKSSSSGDDRDSSSSGKLVEIEKVDLSQSDLDVKNSNNPPSNFSIRDYVFSTRSKNVKTNWPFSQKSLQLCLGHGVKDLLPPFQSIDNPRTQPVKTCVVNKQNKIIPDGERSKISQSCSEIDSVPVSSSCLESGNNILPESRKPRVTINKVPPFKKSSLSSVKLSSTEEDTTRTSLFVISESSMASKTCPVCKKFSSSSNTTLNAHIDQCLSGESTIKWTSNCEVSKHRMKSRKTRLMVDIYTTAPHCTLEDLDRRNGTTFAFHQSFPAEEEMDGFGDDKNQKFAPVNLDKTSCDEGAVYIDADGTKVRILSKFNDGQAACSKVVHDSAPKKFIKGDKGSKFLSTKKKKKKKKKKKHKNHAQKYHKLLKSGGHGKKFCTRSEHISEIDSAQGRSFPGKQNTEKDECLAQRLRSQENIKVSEPGTIIQWACSKRTGVTRKMFNHQGPEGSTSNEVHDNVGINLYANQSCALRNLNSSTKPVFFQKSRKRLEDVQCESHDVHDEQPYLKTRVGFPLLDSQTSQDNKRSSVLQKRKAKHLKADDSSAHYSGGDTTNELNHASSQRNFIADVNTVRLRNANNFTVNRHAFSSKAKKFSSLRKNLLLVSQASVPECRLGKSQVTCMSKSDEAVTRGSEDDQQHDSSENQGEDFDRSDAKIPKVLKIRKKREVSTKDEIMGMRGSFSTAEPCGHDTGKNNSPSFSFDSVSAGESDDDETHEDDEMEPPPSDGRNFMDFSRHTASGIDSLVGPPKDTQLFGDEFERPFMLGDEQEMFSADDVGKTIVAPDLHVVTEFESSESQGYYHHLEVDPIPIPGPPGSFLPSPGRMCSEDLQGNSSLTSSRLQSSEDPPELLDRDSSDSPVSATSTLSNFTMARSDSRSSGNPRLYAGGTEENKSSLSNDSVDPIVENSVLVTTLNADTERCDLDDTKINVTLPKKGFRSKRDQPCCCARKEGAASQSFALSYQESQLLQRRTMMSSTPLHVSDDSNRRRDNMISVKDSSPNCDLVSPSASNPVLRLMGKNLLVVNKDESISPQEKPSQSNFTTEGNMQFSEVPGVHYGNFQNGDPQHFHSGRISSLAQQHLDVSFSSGYRSHGSYSTPPPQRLHSPVGPFGGSLMVGPFGRHEPVGGGGYNVITEQIGVGNKVGPQISSTIREIIVINDGLESEANTINRESWIFNGRVLTSPSSSTGNLGSSMYYNTPGFL